MRKLHRFILLTTAIIFDIIIGVAEPNPAVLASADVVGTNKSCVLFFRKSQEDFIYRSGNCSQTTEISIVEGASDLGFLNEGETRLSVSSWSVRADQSSQVLDKYLMAVTQCQAVLCKTIVSIEASLAREDKIFLVLDLDILALDEPVEFLEKDAELAAEMLCSPMGGILIISRENIAGERYTSLSIAPVDSEICNKLVAEW